MLTAIKNANVYAPEALGLNDLWLAEGRILALAPNLPSPPQQIDHEVVDLHGMRVIPGLVDGHVHLTGGGGEDGPASRVPPLQFSRLVSAGVTSCIGVLGTDGTTRTMRELVATTLALRQEGLSAWCYTGSYQVPPVTLTGSVRDDLVFIDPIIGVGELAISDHRSSQPTLDEFLRIASDAYVGGMMARKSGVMHLHLGDGPRGMDLIRRALETSELPPRLFHPTHINRREELFSEAQELSRQGVTVDLTAFPEEGESLSAAKGITRWLAEGLAVDRLTCSSDGAGCLPVFDDQGRMIQMDIGQPMTLIQTLAQLLAEGQSLADILPIFTSNPARVAGLTGCGKIEPGGRADLVVLSEDAGIDSVLARGRWMVRDGEIQKYGLFES
jgi:beta-aspartyl-dipeptidase (metallo-type)